jgi:hypothetical protein
MPCIKVESFRVYRWFFNCIQNASDLTLMNVEKIGGKKGRKLTSNGFRAHDTHMLDPNVIFLTTLS